MATTLAGVSLSSTKIASKSPPDTPKNQTIKASWVNFPCKTTTNARGRMRGVRMTSTPPEISAKVEESIKKAKELCSGDAVSGECAAAWDDVEELSAAASHARQKLKESDPLENYCKDNPETEECRLYED
eukprot:TRINITY_DN5195_c0_g1_i1.p1 TRINITY_DN5195_c0_g1~~TRINITY_DN5195_c0_g1_i1.p1  ORF type:complete len:130 (-),score=14.20 TRINITY_DN5195_c0_g1_i1:184-573(-)